MKRIVVILLIISVIINIIFIAMYINLVGIYNHGATWADGKPWHAISFGSLKDVHRKLDMARANQNYIAAFGAEDTDTISYDSAQMYHNIYKLHRKAIVDRLKLPATDTLALDKSRAVIFELDSIMKGAIKAYKFTSDTFDLSMFKNKAFLVYFGNYGNKPRSTKPNSAYQNTTIIQFANRNSPANNWKVNKNLFYNFGDLKPPKVIDDEQIKPN